MTCVIFPHNCPVFIEFGPGHTFPNTTRINHILIWTYGIIWLILPMNDAHFRSIFICWSFSCLVSDTIIYVCHFRSFVYDFIVKTKYKITTLLIFLNVYTHVIFLLSVITSTVHTLYIYVMNDQLQLCIHPRSDNVKRQWQQCWYHLPIQIIYPQVVFSHLQTIINHMGWDLESWEDVPTPPSPTIAPDFAYHNGYETLPGPGAKWHHAQGSCGCLS